MITKPKRRSRIAEAVHEMATDLYEVGLIDEHRMREFDTMCNLEGDFRPCPEPAFRQFRNGKSARRGRKA